VFDAGFADRFALHRVILSGISCSHHFGGIAPLAPVGQLSVGMPFLLSFPVRGFGLPWWGRTPLNLEVPPFIPFRVDPTAVFCPFFK